MASPYTIPTALPFDRLASAGNPYQATTPEQLGSVYAGQHAAATAMNQANYGNIVSGYENVLGAQKSAQDQLRSQYGNLTDRTLGDLELAGTTQRQSIADQYAREQGDLLQRMITSGGYNSTVQASLQRGLLLDKLKAENDIAERVGQQRANYRSQLGLADLGYAERANRDNSALGMNQLGFMERVSSPYPNAGAYDAVAQRLGAQQQQDRDRQAILDAAARGRDAANAAGSTVPVMPGGGEGFFRQPNPQGAGGSGYSGEPISYGVPARSTPPPYIPSMFSQPSSVGAFNGYSGIGGVSPYGASALGGVGAFGGLADQMNPNLIYPGEGEGYANPAGAVAGAAGMYGSFLPASSGLGGLGNYQTDFNDYGYGVGGGGDLNYGTQSSENFYFGG